ncbi:TetR/AcrR family transcriptional regulator [Thermostaphylospora chromogena]|uniref:DNA-binding transcriptional regulator, AcrR family n=1 Tax=Thermostaphylospora chromogena TaxID=35622 RepID=A0A1H1C250_9ACTN|nr:TetR/AcrR family transcriptional regulator [Thermostaphylospora chromogena]SDQ58221.1 DNA-binding transcriptional regulator, AcrR family [Thermostaphylospora chromogena]
MVTARDTRTADGRRGEDGSPRRADAERNIATILATALELFGRNDNVSMADVARAAGLGRVTVYAHFPSRGDLIEALVAHAIREAEQVMDDCLTASQRLADQVLADLIGSAWHTLNRYRRLRAHAIATLGPERLDRHHDPVRQRIEQLLTRGQEQGVFRTDLPIDWMVACVFSVIHTAADEVDVGRMDGESAPRLLTSTVLAALRPQPVTNDGGI